MPQAMIDRTEFATAQLNLEMNNNHLRMQLAEIMKTIDSYDAVDNDEYEKVSHITLYTLNSSSCIILTVVNCN